MRRLLYGLGGLTPWEARRLTIAEALGLLVARAEFHPVLMVTRALAQARGEEASKVAPIEELLARHHERIARDEAKRLANG